MATASLSSAQLNIIKSNNSIITRRLFIKRRLKTTGLFESEWFEITSDVKRWGKFKIEVDRVQVNKFKFNSLKLKLDNIEGRYNPDDDVNSLWFGFANQQRTLVKIEISMVSRTKNANGIWESLSHFDGTFWDDSFWDSEGIWDEGLISFHGIISGNILLSDKNEVDLNVRPLTQVFRDYPAKFLTGLTSVGMTAQYFIENLRDQTSGGNFIFRPFFDDNASNWNIDSTTADYTDLNTNTALDVFDRNCWEIIEQLAEAENFIPYISDGNFFNFVANSSTSTPLFRFYGAGLKNNEFGTTIKQINSFGFKVSDYYARIQVKFSQEDTFTSYVFKEASFTIAGSNDPWNLGVRTFSLENTWIPDTATAETIATNIFNEVSSGKKAINFTTSFIPHLNLLDRVEINYDDLPFNASSVWDANNWESSTGEGFGTLTWDKDEGQALKFTNDPYKLLSIELDFDTLESRFTAKEL